MTDLSATFPLLDAFIHQQMRAGGAPGLALAVTDRDRLVHAATYGYADVSAQKLVTPDTLFEMCFLAL